MERRGSTRGGYGDLRRIPHDDAGTKMAYDQLRFGPRDPVSSSRPATQQQQQQHQQPAAASSPSSGQVKWRYDPMLHSWFEVKRPNTAAPESTSAQPGSIAAFLATTPRTRVPPGSARKAVRFDSSINMTKEFTVDDEPWPSQREWTGPTPKGTACPPKEGLQFNEQMSTQCDWQIFRSPKPPAFANPVEHITCKDALGKDISFLMAETPDNRMIAVNALYHTLAPMIEAERPLSKYSPRANKKTVAKAPPPKGRRNCSSEEFLGSMSHDFVPVNVRPGAQMPSTDGMTYAIWAPAVSSADGKGFSDHITQTGVQKLPTKKYGGSMHPGLYEEEVKIFQRPEDKGKLLKGNTDVLGMVANYQPRF
jgi:hypothetical protein